MSETPDISVKTVKSGIEYRVKVDGKGIHLIYDPENDAVWLYTSTANLGGYNLSRFGGKLSPKSIRTFFLERWIKPKVDRFNEFK